MRPWARPCSRAGCRALANGRTYCPTHTAEADAKRAAYVAAKQKEYDAKRGGASERGYNGRWQKARLTHLRHSPLCVKCQALGITTAATEVHHVIPHRGDWALFWDTENWQSLCGPCHDEESARERRELAEN